MRKIIRGSLKIGASFFLLAFTITAHAQPKVIPLYNGPAPGSETWTWDEKEAFVKVPLNGNVSYNVSKPTLTVFVPDTPNGTSVIICPGGSFHVLNTGHEGIDVARALNKKGITAFLFKYRLVHSLTDDPWKEMMASRGDSSFGNKIAGVRTMGLADARVAIKYVRQHATAYQLDPKKVGIIGFSAGGSMAIGLSINEPAESRPDFSGIIYASYRPAEKNAALVNPPPAFIACATDDTLASSTNSINLYSAWKAVKGSAELHIYSAGGHGLKKGNSPGWMKRFEEWLALQGFIR